MKMSDEMKERKEEGRKKRKIKKIDEYKVRLKEQVTTKECQTLLKCFITQGHNNMVTEMNKKRRESIKQIHKEKSRLMEM